jgi:hypothetical protein
MAGATIFTLIHVGFPTTVDFILLSYIVEHTDLLIELFEQLRLDLCIYYRRDGRVYA